MWREPPDYLALKPGYYTIIVQYNTIHIYPGNNRLPRYGILAWGNTHFPRSSAHLRSHPGEAPTFRALPSRAKSTPPSVTGFRDPPPKKKPAWLQGIPYTTNGVFPVILRSRDHRSQYRHQLPEQLFAVIHRTFRFIHCHCSYCFRYIFWLLYHIGRISRLRHRFADTSYRRVGVALPHSASVHYVPKGRIWWQTVQMPT